MKRLQLVKSLLAALFTLLIAPSSEAQTQGAPFNIFAGERFDTNDDALPVPAANWTAITLPDIWSSASDRNPEHRYSWYRFELPSDSQNLIEPSLYLTRVNLNIEIYVGDIYIGNGGSMSKPVARNWNRPFLFKLSPDLLQRAATNNPYLYVRLAGEPNYGILGPLYLGELANIQRTYRINHLIRIDLSRITAVILTLLAITGLLLWFYLRQTGALLLSLASLFWLIPITYAYVQVFPLSQIMLLRLAHWGIDCAGLCVLLFALNYSKQLQIKYIIGAVVYGVLVLGINLLIDTNYLVRVANLIHLNIQVAFLNTLFFAFRKYWQSKDSGALLLGIGLIVILAASIHDVSLSLTQDVGRWAWDVHVGHLAMPLLFILLSWNLTNNFNLQLKDASHLNDQLISRIADEKQRLAQFYADRELLASENRIKDERECVYRDLHDDLGASLLSLVYSSRSEAHKDLGRSALQDLRDVVSRSSTEAVALEAILQDTLLEQEIRAAKLGLALQWSIDGVGLDREYRASDGLLLSRVLRECTTLVLHRIKPAECKFQILCGHAGLEIVLSIDSAHKLQLSSEEIWAGLGRRVARLSGDLIEAENGTPHLAIWIPHPEVSSDGITQNDPNPQTGG